MARLILKYRMEGLPTGVNSMYRNVPKVGRVLTTDGKQWKAALTKHVGYVVNQMEPPPALTKKDRVALEIVFHTRLPLSSDVDSRVKIVMDCTMKQIGLDDRYVFDLRATKVPSDEDWFEVTLWANE